MVSNASDRFSDEARRRIARAVAAAEAKTSVEIVPVVAACSGRYDRGEDVCGLWVGATAILGFWALWPRGTPAAGGWDDGPAWLEPVLLVAALLVGFVGGALLASRVGSLKRMFTSRSEMRDEVERRARNVFFDQRVHHTIGGTGLLIYVSLLEHMTAVISDQTVLDALGQPVLDDLCTALTAGLAGGDATDALCATIDAAGERLASALPRTEAHMNELADALVTIDGYV